jgi:putative aminopeptidase FrvX
MDKTGISQLLRQLVSVDGLSGRESAVAGLVQTLARDNCDEVRVDRLGSVVARRRGAAQAARRIMLAAHMDEIGLIVTKVDNGFLHVGRVGGVDPRSLLGQEVTVMPTGPGAEAYPDGLPGYVGSRPPHLLSQKDRDQVVPLDELRIDLGLPSAFFEAGIVRIGDPVALRGPYTEMLGGRVAAKALDNRAGVAAMLAALAYLAGTQGARGAPLHSWDVFAVATTREETGLQGAITSTFGVAPDLAIAIDVTHGDAPGLNSAKTVEMSKGPAIGWGPNLHPAVVRKLREVADALEIPHVTEPLPGPSGTDAWAIQVSREGIPTGLLSIPLRYMHSTTETVVVADVDRTARLLAAFIGRLDEAFLGGLAEEV